MCSTCNYCITKITDKSLICVCTQSELSARSIYATVMRNRRVSYARWTVENPVTRSLKKTVKAAGFI